MQAAIVAQPVGEGGNHRLYTESCAFAQGFSLSFTGTESGRSEQRASALTVAVSAMAWLKTVGGWECREGERLSRGNHSVKSPSFPAAERRCHAHSACQTASQASKWQLRMC